ncbi:TetR/AcrR family transcriptional regulator [Mycolicibacterium sp. CBM1]
MESASFFPHTAAASYLDSSSEARIRDAALTKFASGGIAGTSMRAVAEAAGVSIGLVQHYFGTKAALVKAVDQFVLGTLNNALVDTATADAPDEALANAGKRLIELMAEAPVVIDYLVRALTEGGEMGTIVFDGLVRISQAQGDLFQAQGSIRDGLDPLWVVLNPLILRMGALLLRPHVERYLGESLFTKAQLQRWDDAVTRLIREGQFE